MANTNSKPWLKLMISLVVGFIWFYLLYFGLSIGSTKTPPLGEFLNPFEGFYRSNTLTYYDGEGDLPGLTAPVVVNYDERLVPHIYASSEHDLYYVQGYVQAQHRLFQLDLTARSAEGRLSEVLGERTLAFDRIRRRIGGGQLAKKIDALWAKDERAYTAVSRYAEGVNAYIASLEQHEYPIEYKLLDFSPEQWSPYKTALVAISMAYTLNFANSDIPRSRTLELLGKQSYAFLFPERDPSEQPVIPAGTKFLRKDSALIKASEEHLLGQLTSNFSADLPKGNDGNAYFPEGIGSNNWAISARRSKSGKPMLANDPHLGLSLPSIWFESELHAGGLHVHGVNLPGVPGVTIGFNEQIAWGVTNVGIDVLDWYEIEYTNPSKTRYRTSSGGTSEVVYRVESIGVKGSPSILDTVTVTEYGPIVYTDPEDHRAGLAMNWLTLEVPSSETINAFLKLNRAKNLREFVSASYDLKWPAQNLVFASKENDIALRVSGTFPRRIPQQGRFVLSNKQVRATGYLPAEANPIAVNPIQGYLTSTNQVSTDETYPYYYFGKFERYRSRRINQLLRSNRKLDVAAMKAYQLDSYSVLAEDFVEVLLAKLDRKNLSTTSLGLIAELEAWDYSYEKDKIAPVVFDLWLKNLKDKTWDEIRENGTPYIYPESWRLLQLLREDPLSPWFDVVDTEGRESANELVNEAFLQAVDSIDLDIDWASHNNVDVMHLARIPAFSRQNLNVSGAGGTLRAQRGNFGPSWRMIVELGEAPVGHVIYPGGQSGRPGHPMYDNMIDDWVEGNYYEVRLKKSSDADQAWISKQLNLKP